MHKITRSYEFSAAPTLEGHPKCSRLHGHNYEVLVSLEADDDSLEDGMVMDFAEMDTFIKPLIDMLDHKCIISKDNYRCRNRVYEALQLANDLAIIEIEHSTAEEISKWLCEMIIQKITNVKVTVTVWENRRSSAMYTAS